MKKVISPHEMKRLEEEAKARGFSEEMMMEEAGKKIAEATFALIEKLNLPKKVTLFAGKGNNGGDGYVAARYLFESGVDVEAIQVTEPQGGSLCAKKREEFCQRAGREKIVEKFQENTRGVVLDAIFGTGFSGKAEGESLSAIDTINHSKWLRIAIDVPSGLCADTGVVEGVAVFADYTLTVELPKIGFFLQEGWNHVGKIITLPIGLETAGVTTELDYLEEEDVVDLLPKITRNRHKYQAGHVVGLAGSPGMAGAALMAAFSALKSGAGIVHLLCPESMDFELVNKPWEVIHVPFKETKEDLTHIREWLLRAKSCFIGPGLGLSKTAEFLLHTFWDDFKHKAVLDADCLNFLAKKGYKKPFGPLPGSILTPHIGEMARLLGETSAGPITLAFLKKCAHFTEENLTHLVLKGGPSFLFSAGKTPIVMPRGDPGMATAGSGDVLTGVLAGLLAQGMTAYHALLLGPYLHGLAGEIAAEKETSYSMTATSIIKYLPYAFQRLLLESCLDTPF